MVSLSALMEEIPARELEIRRLCARDAGFRRVCDHYELAMKALRHWESTGCNADRAAEYRQIAGEIAAEIAARLDTASAQSRGGMITPSDGDADQPKRFFHLTTLHQEQT